MNVELLRELDYCISLCQKLESLLQEDSEEIAWCMRGEVYQQYLHSTETVRDAVADLKQKIKLLRRKYESMA